MNTKSLFLPAGSVRRAGVAFLCAATLLPAPLSAQTAAPPAPSIPGAGAAPAAEPPSALAPVPVPAPVSGGVGFGSPAPSLTSGAPFAVPVTPSAAPAPAAGRTVDPVLPVPSAFPPTPSTVSPPPFPPAVPRIESGEGSGYAAPSPRKKAPEMRREMSRAGSAQNGAPSAGMAPTPSFGSASSGIFIGTNGTPPPPAVMVGGYPANSNRLAEAIMVEETQGDPMVAAHDYEALVAGFDQQRSAAAQAVFRLAELYRRLGRIEESRALHGRILREFVDFPELAQASLRVLSFTPSAPSITGGLVAPPTPAPEQPFNAAAYRADSLRLIQKELARRKELVSKGVVPESELFPLERDLLELQQQIARDEDLGSSRGGSKR